MDKRSDHDLLSEFAANASETAFATLVDRHIGLVYSAAFRHLNDSHLAEDVTQAVFVLLARKASTISKNTILAGWLYRTARFVSADVLKIETRRRKREQDAAETSSPATAPAGKWEQAAPHLDEALSRLGEKDRATVLLRYFEGKSLHEVGEALGCTEEAARKRVDRAVERLRTRLKERNALMPGVRINGEIEGGIEELLANAAGNRLPAGVAIRATTAALADSVATGANVIALVKGALQLMFLTKLKQILATVAVVAVPTILWLEIPESEKGPPPGATAIINRHLAESGSESLRIVRERHVEAIEPVGTACMSCHRSNRSMQESLVRQVYARGEWQDRARGLNGTFELRIAGPGRALETIHITGLGTSVRGRNERAAWSINAGHSVRALAQPEAEQFMGETDWLIWPSEIEAGAPADVDGGSAVEFAKFDQKKCYRIPNGRNEVDKFESAHYFDIESGLRIGSTWKPSGSTTGQTNLFQHYQSFETIVFPSRIVRRKTDSEEVFTVTNLVIADVPLRVFRPPRSP